MSTTIQHISSFVDRWAPEKTQMDFDNVGLLVGDPQARVGKVLTCLDVTPEVVNEAAEWGADLIVAHHPLIFNKLDSINPTDHHGRMIYELIQNNIGVLAAHTNLDAAKGGVSVVLAETIGLSDIEFLDASYDNRFKIIFNGPSSRHTQTQKVLEEHRAGNIQFLQPVNAENGITRTEALIEDHQLSKLTSQLQEEGLIASGSIETYRCENPTPHTGMGAIGIYEGDGMQMDEFLHHVSEQLDVEAIRYAGEVDKVKKVSVCGGAGVFLTSNAIEAGADAFITSDIKYHNYFIEKNQFIIADVGHYESEIPIASKLQQQLSEAFEEIEVSTTSVVTNPMKIFSRYKKSEIK